MSALASARLFHAIRLHFNNEKYNAIKFKYKTNVSFVSDAHLAIFKLIHKKYKREIVEFYATNLYENSCCWVQDLLSDECEEVYLSYKRYHQAQSYNFKNELLSLDSNLNDLLKIKNGIPVILKYTLQKKISVDTLLMMEKALQFYKYWDEKLKDDLVWKDFMHKSLKYSYFIKCDQQKVLKIMKEVFKK